MTLPPAQKVDVFTFSRLPFCMQKIHFVAPKVGALGRARGDLTFPGD